MKKNLKYIMAVLLVIALLLGLKMCSGESLDKVTGKITTISGTVDEEFAVETDSALLIREVEMVQWYKDDEKGVRLVLANYPIESFEDNGKKYENPSFPTDVVYSLFYGEASIDGIKLSNETLKLLAYNGAEMNLIKELDEYGANVNNMSLYKDDYYTTPSDDWNLGDIRVSFYELKDDSTFTITGQIVEGTLEVVETSTISK